MTISPRTTVALGAALSLCLAAPAAHADKPASPGNSQAAHQHHDGVHPGESTGSADTTASSTDTTASSTDTTAGSTDTTSPATTADPCGYGPATRVFAPWHDHKSYVLTQNGGLESGDAGWTLVGGGAVAAGNESLFVNAPTDTQSLALPAGSAATSPATCVASGQPTFRFVARTSGDRRSRLKVEVLFTGRSGKQNSLVAGKLRGGDAWQPTKKLAVRLGRVKGAGRLTTASISFRFTPVGAGDWQVDDLFLDPRARA